VYWDNKIIFEHDRSIEITVKIGLTVIPLLFMIWIVSFKILKEYIDMMKLTMK